MKPIWQSAILTLLLAVESSAQAPLNRRNDVDLKWTEMAKTVGIAQEWTIRVPDGRRASVGMGVWYHDKPMGEVKHFTTSCMFTTVGVGKIKVKFIDNGPNGTAELYTGKVDPNNLPTLPDHTP